MTTNNWIAKIKNFCHNHNILLDYLAEVLNEPKVVPMIRGKAFEFSVMLNLQQILDPEIWHVEKPIMNAQFGYHDTDVRVTHNPTGKIIRVECKLAKNKAFLSGKDVYKIRVKCMRSRTLGSKKVEGLAPKLGISINMLSVHNDQYLPQDFDVVVTSIGNAFYQTDRQTNEFKWTPTQDGITFLQKLAKMYRIEIADLQEFAFNCMYIAKSSNLVVRPENGVICTRKGCPTPENCGFIPNYPLIYFDKETGKTIKHWIHLRGATSIFESIVYNS